MGIQVSTLNSISWKLKMAPTYKKTFVGDKWRLILKLKQTNFFVGAIVKKKFFKLKFVFIFNKLNILCV